MYHAHLLCLIIFVYTINAETEITEEMLNYIKFFFIFIQDILHNKNAMIKDLEYELARICKAHDDMLETYEEKLGQYGIPKQELGFTPLRVLPQGQGGLARGPAGLVTKNK